MSEEGICRGDFGVQLDDVVVAGLVAPLPLSSTISSRELFPFSPNYP